MTSNTTPSFVVLAILDGWGIAKDSPGNAITRANTQNMKRLWLSYPHTYLAASGKAVGLPRNEDGNTETGHINLGAGRIVYQALERINMAIADGSFFNNGVLLGAVQHAKKYNSKLHLMGLVGAGGVHSNLDHLIALIQLVSKQNFRNLYLHLFTDGRDSPPTAAKIYIKRIDDVLAKERVGVIASIIGRYWAMDRDQRWDRTKKAYLALTKGEGKLVSSSEEAIDASYSNKITDEFIEPSLIVEKKRKSPTLIQENDAVIFFNFRIDRPRQLTKAFVFEDFANAAVTFDFDPYKIKYETTHISKGRPKKKEPFKRGKKINNLYFATMTEYGKPLTAEGARPAFPPGIIMMPISGSLSVSENKQLKITESEKERFVTYYFNGLRDKPFPLEDRIIIPSPLVTTYDQTPEMSAHKITERLLSIINYPTYKLIVVNYPNVDMVGHTGNIKQTIKAVETVDDCIGKVSKSVVGRNGALIVTADHGNAEEMINLKSGEMDTEHSSNPVPFIAVTKELLGKGITLRTGILADIAPTILNLLNLTVSSSMTGRNLLANLY